MQCTNHRNFWKKETSLCNMAPENLDSFLRCASAHSTSYTIGALGITVATLWIFFQRLKSVEKYRKREYPVDLYDYHKGRIFMSQLIHMRQRIKAIGTIKKITSAMRLISRSFHTRMYREQIHYKEYQESLTNIFKTILIHAPAEVTPSFSPQESSSKKELLIIIGSQKGLCGSFNAPVFYWIDNHKKELLGERYHIIAMGKRVTEHLKKIGVHTIETLPELKLTTISPLTQDLFKLITNQKPGMRVTTLSCFSKSLFSQECKEQVILPFTLPKADTPTQSSFDYVWSHDSEYIIKTLVTMHITEKIRTTLFSSLLAEHNARFTAMDNATRNAENFLDTMKLQFNKMRQAKITKELSELAGAFETQGLI